MKIDAQRESDSIVNRPTTKPHRHGVVSSMLPSFLDSSLNCASFRRSRNLWLRVSIFETKRTRNCENVRAILKLIRDCQQRADPNTTVISPRLECVLPRKILLREILIFIETDRGKSILKNLAFLLSIIIIQSNVELLR